MDDASLYGPVAYRLPRGEAVARGLVVPLQLVFVDASDAYEEIGRRMPSLRVLLDGLGGPRAEAQSVSREHAEQVLAIWDCHRRHGTDTAFTFHSSNARAMRFQEAAASVLAAVASLEGDGGAGFLTGRVHGGMPVSHRQEVLHTVGARDGRLKVISNCRVLGEGVDVPAVDMVVFVDAKSSHVDILQSMARASRVSPGKTRGLVLVMAGEGALEIDVLRAFAESDEELREAFDLMAREQARTGRTMRVDELPPAVLRLWGGNGVELERMVGWLSTSVRDLAGPWERKHGLLLAYKAREGHCDVPNQHQEQGDALGGWLARQRTAYKRGTLEARRAAALDAAGVVWDVLGAAWERRHGLLLEFKAREEHCDVPQKHEEQGDALGEWLARQRAAYKGGTLDVRRVTALEAVGALSLNVTDQAAAWEQRRTLLLEFKAREGHCDVPQKHEEQGDALGKWLARQRAAYKGGTLDSRRAAALEAAGVALTATDHAAAWERMHGLLLAFKAREGHCEVPTEGHCEPGEQGDKLGGWLGWQRVAYKRGSLEEQRVTALDAAGVVWDPVEAEWARMHGLLLAFEAREGHCEVPQKHEEQGEGSRPKGAGLRATQKQSEHGGALGWWVSTQRKAYKRGTLEPRRLVALEAAGVVFKAREEAEFKVITRVEAWERKHGLLLAFKARVGHCEVPQKHEEQGEKLGYWLMGQRAAYKGGTLEARRTELLEECGVRWSHVPRTVY